MSTILKLHRSIRFVFSRPFRTHFPRWQIKLELNWKSQPLVYIWEKKASPWHTCLKKVFWPTKWSREKTSILTHIIATIFLSEIEKKQTGPFLFKEKWQYHPHASIHPSQHQGCPCAARPGDEIARPKLELVFLQVFFCFLDTCTQRVCQDVVFHLCGFPVKFYLPLGLLVAAI